MTFCSAPRLSTGLVVTAAISVIPVAAKVTAKQIDKVSLGHENTIVENYNVMITKPKYVRPVISNINAGPNINMLFDLKERRNIRSREESTTFIDPQIDERSPFSMDSHFKYVNIVNHNEYPHQTTLGQEIDMSLFTFLDTSKEVDIADSNPRTAASIYGPQVPPGWFYVDGQRSVMVNLPKSAAVSTNGFGYYVSNQRATTGVKGNAVGVFGTTTCEVDNCSSWGMNPTLIDGTTGGAIGAGAGRKLIGAEYDFAATQTGTTIQGISLLGSSTVQPRGGANGFSCGSLGGPAKWMYCFVVPDGVATGGISLGSIDATGVANSPSIPIGLNFHGVSGTGGQIRLQSVLGVLNVSDPTKANYVSLQPAATGAAPTLTGQGTDSNVGLNLAGKGTGAVVAKTSFVAQGGLISSGFTLFNNDMQVVPTPQPGLSLSANFLQGTSDVDFWNTQPSALISFAFKQVTELGKSLDLMTFSKTANISFQPLKLPKYTASTLPECNNVYQDATAVVTDAFSPTYKGKLTGGGSVRTLVFCDGASWTTH